MQKTENYQLNQWDKTDRIQMEDFNADNAKIDAALANIPKIAVGTYTGTGTYGSDGENTLTFDFEPTLVVISRNIAETSAAGTLLIRGQTKNAGTGYVYQSNSALSLTVSWSGNTVSWYSASTAARQLNSEDATYFYFALGV